MEIPQAIIEQIRILELPAPRSFIPIGGGSTATCARCQLEDGRSLFAKTGASAPPGLFAAEAHGLTALAGARGLRVPKVLAVSEQALLLEFIEQAAPAADYWQQLARGLATQHRQRAPAFGFERDNFCGLTPQPNPWTADGYDFFANQRLLYQADRAARSGLLAIAERKAIDHLCGRLPELIPAEAPSLLHGDLWSGNIHVGESGEPVLVDPACHYGWREADLAMMELFGAPPTRFYECYSECYPLTPGWRERTPLYNLYHLLNHLNLFGSSYLASVRAVIRRFA